MKLREFLDTTSGQNFLGEEPRAGLQPATPRLEAECSMQTELPGRGSIVQPTPGPWGFVYDPEDGALLEIAGPCREHKRCRKTVVFHPAHSRVLQDGKSIHDPKCHCEANARLIGAAPELLEALEELVWHVRDKNPAKIKAIEIIRKAKGSL